MQTGELKSLSLWGNTSPCSHICRFCQIGDRAPKRFPFERWRGVVQRFRDWKESRGLDVVIDHGWPGPAFNFDLATYDRMEEWLGERFTVISLGGVKKRAPAEMREWLLQRKDRGLERIHGVFVGCGDVHDRWVGRRGDYEFLLQAFRTSLDIGLGYSVTMYLTKSTLPLLDRLAADLDGLPSAPKYKHVRQFYYGGYAAYHEAERITAADLANAPAWARESFQQNFDPRPERHWAELIRAEAAAPVDVHLNVELTPANIVEFETRPCDELHEELMARARLNFDKLPPLPALAADHADLESPRLYERFEVTRLWIDRFLAASHVEFDRGLLHEHIGMKGTGSPALD
jgi:hypothetical protein